MSGIGSSSSALKIAAIACASRRFSASEQRIVLAMYLASAPAQKTVPAPARTTARTSRRRADLDTEDAQSASSAVICSLNALRTSGRFRVRYSTAPSRLTLKNSYAIKGEPRNQENTEKIFL